MEALKAFEFGHLIAFVLPGLVATRAAAFYLSSLGTALEKATSGGEGAVGPLLWVLLAGATLGLTISVMRQQWLDPLFGWVYGLMKRRDPNFKGEGKAPRIAPPAWRPNYRAISASTECAALFEKSVANVYRYYQFITNLGIAVALLALAIADQPVQVITGNSNVAPVLWTWKALSLGAGALLLTGYLQFEGWCRVHNQITSPFVNAQISAPQAAGATAAGTATPAAGAPAPTTTTTGARSGAS